MIDVVLLRLETLQAELVGLDPAGEVNVSDHVAAMAKALRDVLATAGVGAVEDLSRAARGPLQALAG